MEQHIPVNERSFNGQANDITGAAQLLRELASTLRELTTEARRRGAKATIYSGEGLSGRSCAVVEGEAQQFGQTLFDRRIERDIRLALQILFSNTPYSEKRLLRHKLQHSCTIVHNGEDATESSIAAAAAFGGWLVSLNESPSYPNQFLEVDYCEADDIHLPPPRRIALPHFKDYSRARAWRRRYVPNPKHHPNQFKGREWSPASVAGMPSPMPLDTDYDPWSSKRETELRDQRQELPEYRAQKLLDRAVSALDGKQLFACGFDPFGKLAFFAFQPDSMHGYHGYLISSAAIPSEILQQVIDLAK